MKVQKTRVVRDENWIYVEEINALLYYGDNARWVEVDDAAVKNRLVQQFDFPELGVDSVI